MGLSAEIEAVLEPHLDTLTEARREHVILLAIADVVALHQGRPAVDTTAPDLRLPLLTISRSDADAVGAELDWMDEAGEHTRRLYLDSVAERAGLYVRASVASGESVHPAQPPQRAAPPAPSSDPLPSLSTPGQRRHLTAILADVDPSVRPAATAEFLRRYQALFPITLAGMTAREHRGELDSILRKGTARDLKTFLDQHSIDSGDVDDKVARRLASLATSVLQPILLRGPDSLFPPAAVTGTPPTPTAASTPTRAAEARSAAPTRPPAPAPRPTPPSRPPSPAAPSTTEEVIGALGDLGFRRVDDDSTIPCLWVEATPDPGLGTILETDAPSTVFASIDDGWLELFSPIVETPTPPQLVAAHEICAVRRGVGLRLVANDFLCVTVSLPYRAVHSDAIDTAVSSIVDSVALVALAVPAPAEPDEVVR